jgi:hypothetical protein
MTVCLQWKESREAFEALRTYCKEELSSIPLTFVLGFYVSLIVNRYTSHMLLPVSKGTISLNEVGK